MWKKIFIIALPLTLLIGAIMIYSFMDEEKIEFNDTYYTYEDNLSYEYYEEINLEDILVFSKNAKLITSSFIDTKKLGNNKYTFEYIVDEKKFTGNISYEVVDTTKPLILNSSNYTIKTGNEFNMLDYTLCADNHDKNPECKIIGEYDINTAGIYNLEVEATDSSNNQTTNKFTLTVKDEVTTSSYTPTPIYLDDIISKHKNENTAIGIDVSKWQGEVDYEKVKEAGVEFVFIRIGWGHNDDNESVLDEYFKENLTNAKKAGLDVGLYYYSYANTIEEVKKQANWIIDTLDGEKLELPISFDWEEWSKFNEYDMSLVDINNLADAFISEIEKNGYEAINYGSASYLRNIWTLYDHDIWLAHYTSQTNYEGSYYIWQLTNAGVVNGVSGDVDINVLYKNKK